jgi:hypothetical protein
LQHYLNITIALLVVTPLWADRQVVNCDRGVSLQHAIDRAEPGDVITTEGSCLGPIVIANGRLTIKAATGSTINGQTKDAITVQGASNIVLENLDVANGANGIVLKAGASAAILNSTIHDNGATGILLEGNSSATLSGGSARHNGLNGVDAEASSSVTITGNYLLDANAVFGINVNGSSSLLFAQANLISQNNVLGAQIGTSASAFISDSTTTPSFLNNLTTGLTIVSGAHMVAFGGTITSQGNGVHGVSVDSKAGLDLDGAATLESHHNAGDGVHLEETSVMTLFNTTAFSGAPGTTTLNTHDNVGSGVGVFTGSNVTVIHQAAIESTANKIAGITVDGGSSVTLVGSQITGNTTDINLSFGSRSDITTSTVGSISCDHSVISRGTVVCP